MTSNDETLQLKQTIKEWERNFKKTHGKVPTREDIKQDSKVHQLYKRYKKLKFRNKDTKEGPNDACNNNSKVSSREKASCNDYGIDFTALNSSSEEETEEKEKDPFRDLSSIEGSFGPTPQANGRVLSIFDVRLTPPESSPLKGRNKVGSLRALPTSSETPEFKTPTKNRVVKIEPNSAQKTYTEKLSLNKRLLFALQNEEKSDAEGRSDASEGLLTPACLVRHNSLFNASPLETRNEPPVTPSKTVSMLETRQFLTPTKSPKFTNFQVSPSPLKPHRLFSFGNKRLSDLFLDKRKHIDVTEDKLLEIDNSEDDVPIAKEQMSSNFRKKTQKRTTRRFKLKPVVDVYESQDLKKINVHEEIDKINNENNKKLLAYMNSDPLSCEDDDDDDQIGKSKKPQSSTGRKIKPISQNYRRLKINNPKSAAFKRRMRRNR